MEKKSTFSRRQSTGSVDAFLLSHRKAIAKQYQKPAPPNRNVALSSSAAVTGFDRVEIPRYVKPKDKNELSESIVVTLPPIEHEPSAPFRRRSSLSTTHDLLDNQDVLTMSSTAPPRNPRPPSKHHQPSIHGALTFRRHSVSAGSGGNSAAAGAHSGLALPKPPARPLGASVDSSVFSGLLLSTSPPPSGAQSARAVSRPPPSSALLLSSTSRDTVVDHGWSTTTTPTTTTAAPAHDGTHTGATRSTADAGGRAPASPRGTQATHLALHGRGRRFSMPDLPDPVLPPGAADGEGPVQQHTGRRQSLDSNLLADILAVTQNCKDARKSSTLNLAARSQIRRRNSQGSNKPPCLRFWPRTPIFTCDTEPAKCLTVMAWRWCFLFLFPRVHVPPTPLPLSSTTPKEEITLVPEPEPNTDESPQQEEEEEVEVVYTPEQALAVYEDILRQWGVVDTMEKWKLPLFDQVGEFDPNPGTQFRHKDPTDVDGQSGISMQAGIHTSTRRQAIMSLFFDKAKFSPADVVRWFDRNRYRFDPLRDIKDTRPASFATDVYDSKLFA